MADNSNPFLDTLNQINQQRNQAAAAEQQERLRAMLAQETQQRGIQQALDLKKQLEAGADGKSYNIGLSPGGGVTLGEREPDPLRALLQQQQMQQKKDESLQKGVERYGERIKESKIPERQEVAEGLASSIKKKGLAIGPISSKLPSVVTSVGEQLGLAKPGVTEQKQNLEAMITFVRHPVYGASLTGNEKRSADEAFNIVTGASRGNREAALQKLFNLYNQALSNVKATASPEISAEYEKRGGLKLNPIDLAFPSATAQPNSTEQPPMSFEEFKARKRAGKL